MSKRQEYLEKMEVAFDRLQVKASLAKLEARDVKHDLLEEYDGLRDQFKQLAEATDARWDSLRSGFEAGWQAFRKRYGEVMEEHRNSD